MWTFFRLTHLRSVVSVLVLQAVSLLLSLGITLWLSNVWGSEGLGVYAYATSWITLLGLFACLGLDQAAIKQLPAYMAAHQPAMGRGFVKFSSRLVVITSVLASVVLFSISLAGNFPSELSLRQGLWVALPALPLVAMINFRLALVRSFHQALWSQLPDKVIRPALFAALLIVVWFMLEEGVSIFQVLGLAVASIFVTWIVSTFVAHRILRNHLPPTSAVPYQPEWLRLGFSLLWINGSYYYLTQIPILILGSIQGSEHVGLFSIAYRISDLEGYVLYAINVVLAPLIAQYHAEGQKERLQHVVTTSLRFGFFIALPLMLACLLYPRAILSLFGKEFEQAAWVLVMLTAAQLINYATGSVGYLLTMTGHHLTAARLLTAGVVGTTLLCLGLIPPFGYQGAAIAVAINMVVMNVAMAIAVYRKTGIYSHLLHRLP